MKYVFYIAGVLIVVVVIYFGFLNRGKVTPIHRQETDQSVNSPGVWETKTDQQSSITVSVTPLVLGKDVLVWKFDIALNTHSGSLDQDLVDAAVLSDNTGTTYKPISWEGPGPGGHHRHGVLVFHSIKPAPSYVELTLKDIDGIPERSFRWDVK